MASRTFAIGDIHGETSHLFKLMAYKDEYEVARLYAEAPFHNQLARQFEGDYRLKFHLAPPLFASAARIGRLLAAATAGSESSAASAKSRFMGQVY